MIDLKNSKVLVTGSSSMIGRSIVAELNRIKAITIEVPHSKYNLLDINNTYNLLRKTKPDYIIHAAGWNGGIEWNRQFPATIYYRTATMALNVFTAASECKSAKKIVGILASCSYPDSKIPAFEEDCLWNGKPNSTVECHGLAKRIIADYGRQINKQFGINCISCILNNSYGPHDSFDPVKTKVVAAIIKKIVEAKKNNEETITCWGTGSPLREFIYCLDAGKAIVRCLENYDNTKLPINITSGEEITIFDLTMMIANIVGYTGSIIWDTSKPDGQMRKSLNGSRLKDVTQMDFTPLRQGLTETINWYTESIKYGI